MNRLVRVELRRLWMRRMTKLALVAGVLFLALAMPSVINQASPVSADEAAQNQQYYDQARHEWDLTGEQMLADCRRSEQEARDRGESADFHCEAMPPQPEGFGRVPTRFADLAPQVLEGLVYPFGLVAFLIGASFVAAEIATGSMATWLTFEPRRTRVLTSKLVATALFLLPAMAVLVGATLATVYAVSTGLGTAGSATVPEWTSLAAMAARIIAVATGAGVLGACLGTLLRHTAAAIGVTVGYAVAVEGALRAWRPESARYLVAPNVEAWVRGGSTFGVEQCSRQSDGGYACSFVDRFISQGWAATRLPAVLAVAVLLSVLAFRRRDIT